MTAPALQPPPPTWTMPIVVGTLFTVFVQMLPMAVTSVMPMAGTLVPCCCAIEVVPIGILPALLAYRQDTSLMPGDGFKVSFIAGGLGSVVVALMVAMQMRGADNAEVRGGLSQVLQDINEEARKADETVAQLTPEQIDAAVQQLIDWLPFLPVIGACIATVFAGICGLATIRVLRAR